MTFLLNRAISGSGRFFCAGCAQFCRRILSQRCRLDHFAARKTESSYFSFVRVERLKLRPFAQHMKTLCTRVSFAGLDGQVTNRANVLLGFVERGLWGRIREDLKSLSQFAGSRRFALVLLLPCHGITLSLNYVLITFNSTSPGSLAGIGCWAVGNSKSALTAKSVNSSF